MAFRLIYKNKKRGIDMRIVFGAENMAVSGR